MAISGRTLLNGKGHSFIMIKRIGFGICIWQLLWRVCRKLLVWVPGCQLQPRNINLAFDTYLPIVPCDRYYRAFPPGHGVRCRD